MRFTAFLAFQGVSDPAYLLDISCKLTTVGSFYCQRVHLVNLSPRTQIDHLFPQLTRIYGMPKCE